MVQFGMDGTARFASSPGVRFEKYTSSRWLRNWCRACKRLGQASDPACSGIAALAADASVRRTWDERSV